MVELLLLWGIEYIYDKPTGDRMKVSIFTKEVEETEVELHCRELNDKVNKLYTHITSFENEIKPGLPKMLPAYKGNIMSLVNPESIILFYSSSKKIYIKTAVDSYEIKQRLYEIEQMVENSHEFKFIRVSNSDIVNFDKVENLDMNLNGTVKINFKDGSDTFISRRYTNRVMKQLGVKSRRETL